MRFSVAGAGGVLRRGGRLGAGGEGADCSPASTRLLLRSIILPSRNKEWWSTLSNFTRINSVAKSSGIAPAALLELLAVKSCTVRYPDLKQLNGIDAKAVQRSEPQYTRNVTWPVLRSFTEVLKT